MPSSKDEDRALAKACRQAVARSALDISELTIIAIGGYIELGGKVRAPRGQAGALDVRKEFKQLQNVVRQVRGVKDCYGERVMVIEG
jgi:hypothetical protein